VDVDVDVDVDAHDITHWGGICTGHTQDPRAMFQMSPGSGSARLTRRRPYVKLLHIIVLIIQPVGLENALKRQGRRDGADLHAVVFLQCPRELSRTCEDAYLSPVRT
jgi:hypothetical protein